MKFCQEHWDKLCDSVKRHGLWHLVPRSGQEAVARMKQEVAGTDTPATFDPLMSAHWQIATRAIQIGGLYLMTGDFCPVCEAIKHTPIKPDGDPAKEWTNAEALEAYWIDGPVASRLEYAKSVGLIPTPGVEPKAEDSKAGGE